MADPRDPDMVTHRQIDLIRQRIYGIALGYEDLNDHDTLRTDPLWQSAVERGDALASSPTLCRLESRADRGTARTISEVFVEQFIASFASPPAELVLDFDATDDRVHGNQEGRAFHGYYGDWCFLPLYVFCGEQLLVSYLRPSNIDPARHAWAILKLLAERLRREWPGGSTPHDRRRCCPRHRKQRGTGALSPRTGKSDPTTPETLLCAPNKPIHPKNHRTVICGLDNISVHVRSK